MANIFIQTLSILKQRAGAGGDPSREQKRKEKEYTFRKAVETPNNATFHYGETMTDGPIMYILEMGLFFFRDVFEHQG